MCDHMSISYLYSCGCEVVDLGICLLYKYRNQELKQHQWLRENSGLLIKLKVEVAGVIYFMY